MVSLQDHDLQPSRRPRQPTPQPRGIRCSGHPLLTGDHLRPLSRAGVSREDPSLHRPQGDVHTGRLPVGRRHYGHDASPRHQPAFHPRSRAGDSQDLGRRPAAGGDQSQHAGGLCSRWVGLAEDSANLAPAGRHRLQGPRGALLDRPDRPGQGADRERCRSPCGRPWPAMRYRMDRGRSNLRAVLDRVHILLPRDAWHGERRDDHRLRRFHRGQRQGLPGAASASILRGRPPPPAGPPRGKREHEGHLTANLRGGRPTNRHDPVSRSLLR